jgi:hypothetical protein
MDCLYSQADIDTLRTFFAQVHGAQEAAPGKFEAERFASTAQQ